VVYCCDVVDGGDLVWRGVDVVLEDEYVVYVVYCVC